MTKDLHKKIRELEEKISFLSSENESMAERAEEIFLLVMVSESIREIKNRCVIVETVLEKISILKDIPLCCYCTRKGKKLIIKLSYASYTNSSSLKEIELSDEIITGLQNGIYYITNSEARHRDLFNSISEQNFTPGSALIIPHKSISNVLSYFLFADDDKDSNRLSDFITLIHEVIHIMSDKIDNLYLLEELRKINLDLESKISDRTSELWETNRLLRKEIEEKRKAEEEIKLKNEELNNFVYRVSHDLRAPITSVEGLLNIMKLELQSKSSDLEPFILLLGDRMRSLDRFIQDILSYSRNIRTSITADKIDFKKIIASCFEELEYLDNTRIIKKTVKVTENPFYNDKVRIYEVFRNLISNAIKYADKEKADKRLLISIKISDRKADIIIRDNGIGIDKDILPKIFEILPASSSAQSNSNNLFSITR